MPAVEAEVPSSPPRQVCWRVPESPALEKQRRVEVKALLASQVSLVSELQVQWESCLKNQSRLQLRKTLDISLWPWYVLIPRCTRNCIFQMLLETQHSWFESGMPLKTVCQRLGP